MSFDLLTIDFHAKDADKQFTHSLHSTGFAVIKNHPISAELVDAVYAEWKAFFARPEEEKMEYLYDKQSYLGYYPFRTESAKYTKVKNLMEYFHYSQLQGTPKNMSGNTSQLYLEMNSLARTILKWLENNLSETVKAAWPIPLNEMIIDCPRTLIRFLHYPPLTGDEEPGAERAAPHEDIDLLTLLPAATTKGLQVQDNEGQWHEVPCDYGSIVVNAGDMLTALTQGYLPATTHRVNNPTGELAKQSRLSMPLFLHPRDEVVFPSGINAYDFLMERLRANGVA